MYQVGLCKFIDWAHGEHWALGILELATWGKLERNPITSPKVNKYGLCECCVSKKWCVVGKAFFICGHIGLNCRGLPRPTMFLWNWKSQLEMDTDSRNLARSLSKIQGTQHKVWEQLQDKDSKVMQNSYRWKPLVILMWNILPEFHKFFSQSRKLNMKFQFCSYFFPHT